MTEESDQPGALEPGAAPREPQGPLRKGMFGVSGSGDTSGFGGLTRHGPLPAPAERPYGGYFDEVADSLEAAYPGFGDAVLRVVVDRGEITFYVKKERIAEIAQIARDDQGLRFELLASLSGVDYGESDPNRLHVAYHLLSMTYRRRIRLEVVTSDADPHVPSVTGVYPTADWQERETYDMFGVVFDGHPALTRILMPDDWEGHPQRKDYPLGGISVEYKGAHIPPPDERRAYR
jgi:NADH-quinone oxidoreductase subunit C